MGDRYRYSRPRSPVYNPARASLPISISGWTSDSHHDHHLHAVPSSRREVKPIGPRTSLNNTVTPGTVTTYKIKADPPSRAPSRTRRSTLDSNSRPPPIITTNRQSQRPVIHSGGARPASPLRNPYRSSEEDYYAQPASSKHGRRHTKRHSATMDNADMSRLARDRERDRLRVGSSREGGLYPESRSRQGPIYPNTNPRRSNVDEYGEEGYGYTGPKDLVQYDLNHNTPQHHARNNSIEGGRSRPVFTDFNNRPFDTRERGPPPSTRGFDRIARGQTWDQQQQARAPVATMDPMQRPAPFEPMEPVRRANSTRPQSMYHDNRDSRRTSRDDFYEVRDDDRHRKSSRQEPFEDSVEQRGFGIRSDRPERSPRSQWPDRDRPDRAERTDRPVRSERAERYDREYPDDDRGDQKGRDGLATGLGLGSIAGAALSLGTAKTRGDRDDRDDRDNRRRRDYDIYDEQRRRRDMDERDLNDTGVRESKDRRYRDDDGGSPSAGRDIASARDGPTPPKINPPRDSRDVRDALPYSPADPAFLAVGSRDSQERPSSRDSHNSGRRERRQRTYDPNGTAIDSLSDTSAAEDGTSRSRRGSRNATKPPAFNPKDAMDLKGLRDAINAKDAAEAAAAPPKIPPKEPLAENRTPRGSLTKDPREVADIRSGLDDRRPREPLQLQDNRQLRIVSPVRDKADFRPVKGILKQSRPAFPEDPDPIREGVAPLKDAKKDGVPPDARWTKISRKMVNPEALELGKERYESRDDFVIVLRVLSREEVQGYAEVTQRIRAAREEDEERDRAERHRARRERHERHKREGAGEIPRSERRQRHHRSSRPYDRGSSSESDTTEDEDDDRVHDAPRMLEAPSRNKSAVDENVMSGGLGDGQLPMASVASVAGSGSTGRRDGAK